ncbi:MAG: DUF4065 domain-containing protein [Armatimonadetes bacterium]|nr:DUF4065 domain-containing protein [Armatimonadota bacterium]
MASALDVAAYILDQRGGTTVMKLQKLVYYSQAWHLAWEQVPLFDEPIQAWANGPVVRSLYDQHKGRFNVGPGDIGGDSSNLAKNEEETVDAVLDFYWRYTAVELSELTHRERPWQEARRGVAPGVRTENEISQEEMMEYYASL